MSETTAAKQQAPIEPGLFTMPSSPEEKPHLVGSRCRRCGEHFWPKKAACLKCTGRDMEEIALSPRGVIHNFTVARMAPPISVMKPPYVIADIKLPEGISVTGVLTGCDVETVQMGMPVEMVLEKIKEDDAGNDVISFKFKPA